MNNFKQAFLALLLALIFIIPPASMLQNDSSEDPVDTYSDGSVLTNEQGVDPTPEPESSDTETDPLDEEFEVNTEGDKSSKKFLDAFKLNFDPYDPEDGEVVDCIATVHNFGTERQTAYNVNVEFWFDDNYIGSDTIDEILPGENGTATVEWKARYGSFTMRTIADPDGSDGGPDEHEETLDVTRSNYSPVLELMNNASWIKNSDTNKYYIKVINQGTNSDTIDLSLETTKYGNPVGWTIDLSQSSVTLDGGKSAYVSLDVEYTNLEPDYTAEAVVKVLAQSQSDSSRSVTIYTTTNVIHDVPILYIDDDGQHANQPRGTYLVAFNDGQYGPETDEINIGALEIDYKGLYHHVEVDGDYQSGGYMTDQGPSGPPYDSSHGFSTYTIDSKLVYLKDYDIVIWDTGYSETLTSDEGTNGDEYDGSTETHSWYDQTEIMEYFDNGGALIWQSNKGIEWHDRLAGVFTSSFYTDYFLADWCIQRGGKSYEIVGIADDPVGKGVDVMNSFIYSLPGDRSDSVYPLEGAHGVYYAGKGFNTIRYERPWESSSRQRYKSILQTKNWAHFGDYNEYDHPMRVKAVTQSMTWLGVPPRIAGQYDLSIESIESPFGIYVEPNANIPLELMVKNTGHTDITDQFSVIFKVLDMDDGNTVKFQRTEQVNTDIPAGGTTTVSTSWSSGKPQEGGHYNVTFEISFGDDAYSDNNKAYTHQEGKSVKDMAIIETNYEKSTFYWNSTRIGDPTEIWTVVKNQGSVDATFTVDLVIMSPLDTEVFGKSTTITDLAPGREEKISWIWTPRNPAGMISDWHYTTRVHRDAYIATFNVTYNGDDDTDNNERGIGQEDATGIVVLAYYDGSEPRQMKEDYVEVDLPNHVNHSNAYEDTPLHLQGYSLVSPTNAWGAGHYEEEGAILPTIEADWDTVAISPMIDLKNYTEAGGNWLYGGLSGAGTMSWDVSRNYDGNPDPQNVEDATWTQLASAIGGSSSPYAWYAPNNQGAGVNNFVGDEIYMRIQFESDADGGFCGPFVDELAFCGIVNQYNSNDLGVTMVSIDPLIDEEEKSRNIDVTVENFGENKTNSDDRPGFKVQVLIEDDEGKQVYKKSDDVEKVMGIGDTLVVKFDNENGKDWWPPANGIYQIYASVIWEDDGKNIDENPNNDLLVIDGVVQTRFFIDSMEDGSGDWKTTGGADGWEIGTPEGYGSPSPYSGEKCWGTNLDGNYPDLNDGSLTLEHYVDLRTAMDPTLSFWYWLEVEAHDYDTAYVEARTTDQTKYTVLWMNPTPEREGVPYRTEGWKIATLDLEDFAYHEVYIRFRLQTDGDVNYLGWFIDDVGVGGTTPPDYDARTVSIDYPAQGEYIPPSETIEILATVMNVGLNPDVIPVECVATRISGTEIPYPLEDASTGVLNPGDKEQVKFTWNLPGGTAEYKISVRTNLEDDGNTENDEMITTMWADKVFDISILSLYADPMVNDVARTRQVVVEVQNVGNIMLTNNVQIKFEPIFEGEPIPDSGHTALVSLARDEISLVSWEWQSFKYGNYEINVEAIIVDEEDATPLDNKETLTGIFNVETIFSDTREDGDSPAYLDREAGEFKLWDWAEKGVTFWSGDNETNPDVAGWHVDDVGHFSRNSWYGGIPTRERYGNNMRATLISESLDMEDFTNVKMSFFTKYVLEGRQYDYVQIFIANNKDDESWVPLVKFPEDHQSHDSAREPGNTYGWLFKDVEIPDIYLKSTFYIKILLKTDNGITYRGVWIDDITIYGKTTGNHAPVARFSATNDFKNDSYSRHVIQNPTVDPVDLMHIKGNYAFNNLPRPVGVKQGGIPLGSIIEFDAGMSFDPDAGDDVDTLSYNWEFGDGGTGKGEVVSYAYEGDLPLEGYFTVTLTVSDEDEGSSTDTMIVWIGNKAPEANFIVTSAFDTTTPISDENDRVENDVIDVFYGDRLIFQQQATDAENDLLTYHWLFECDSTNYKTENVGDAVVGVVGRDFLFEGLDGNDPIVPVTTVDYSVTLTVSDGLSETPVTYVIKVHPHATAAFTKQVQLGATLLDATVTLTWRGFPEEAAPDSNLISPDRPVFVHIDDTATSPDLNLKSKGGIGMVYDIRAEGVTLQSGAKGFVKAEISVPILNSELEAIGDATSLQDDLRLEYYDQIEKRFFRVPGSHVIAEDGMKYVVGEVNHFSLYTAIVDSIYNTSNAKYAEVLPDLAVTTIQFSRSPAQNGQLVEVRATIKNFGKITARNVDVKIYDGDDLVGDKRIEVILASGQETVVVKETFVVVMLNPDDAVENHNIKCFVNKQQGIDEGSQNYKNNERSDLLQVTSVQQTTPSFESTAMMMVVSAAMVVMASTVVLRKTNRKRDEE